MEPSTTALNNTTVVFLIWTLGVGMADGPGALTLKVPCALVVAADMIGWSAIVV